MMYIKDMTHSFKSRPNLILVLAFKKKPTCNPRSYKFTFNNLINTLSNLSAVQYQLCHRRIDKRTTIAGEFTAFHGSSAAGTAVDFSFSSSGLIFRWYRTVLAATSFVYAAKKDLLTWFKILFFEHIFWL